MDKLPYEKITLPNGLRVVFVPQEGGLAATVLVLVEAGSKYETKEINGLSHFLEHMCFKGTIKRPKAMDIASEFDGLGASYNAFTSQEWTGYYAKVASHHMHKALDLIADMYLNPTLDEKEIEKEKNVIVEEIRMYEDLPPRKVHDLFTTLLYGDQPAGWDIAGTPETVKSLTRAQIVGYRTRHYVPSATTVVVAGGFDRAKALQDITNLFGDVVSTTKDGKLPVRELQSAPQMLLREKESDQTHLVLGLRAFSLSDKRKYILDVLSDVLGGGMSSRLFQKVREELGAAYYIKSATELSTDHGYLAISAGVHHEKFIIVVREIVRELHRMAREPISEQELARAKDHLSGNLILSLETSDSLAMFYGGQEILEKKMESPEAMLRAVRAVTAADIQHLAQELCQNNRLNLAVIGPTKESDELRNALRFEA